MSVEDTHAPPRRFQRAPGAATAQVDGHTVVLSPTDGRYFALNRTGARIWDLLPNAAEQAPSLDDLVDTLASEFAVDPDQCRRDLARYVDEMLANGVCEAV